jgi:hypothetical protein
VSKIPEVGPKSHWIITLVDHTGGPLEPKKVAAKYKTVIGALIREHIPISYRNWKGKQNDRWRVPESVKDDIWEEWILKFFTFPKDYDREQIKKKNKRNHGDMLQEFQGDIVQELYPRG